MTSLGSEPSVAQANSQERSSRCRLQQFSVHTGWKVKSGSVLLLVDLCLGHYV